MRKALWRHTEGLRTLSSSFSRRIRGRRIGKRVLVGVSGELALTYGLKVWNCIAGVDRVEGRISRLSRVEMGSEVDEKLRNLGLEEIDRRRAASQWWDAVLLPDHVPRNQFPRDIPRVSLRHGLTDSKAWKGVGYHFDSRAMLWPDGAPVYSLHLAVARAEARRLVELYPVYRGRVKVVGDLRADEMLVFAAQPDETRRRLGIGAMRVVLIMSTWDRYSLMHQLGESLLVELPRFLKANTDVHVLWTMHPNLWRGRELDYGPSGRVVRPTGKDWATRLREVRLPNVTIIGPQEDWEPYLAVADVALVDHTSLTSTFGILGRPIVPIAVPMEQLARGSFASLLQERLEPVTTAPEALARVLSDQTDPMVRAAGEQLLGYPGESRARTRSALAEFLGIDGASSP